MKHACIVIIIEITMEEFMQEGDMKELFEKMQTATDVTFDFADLKSSIDSIHPINLENDELYHKLVSTYLSTKGTMPCIKQLKVSQMPPSESSLSLVTCITSNLCGLTELDLSGCSLSAEMQDNLHLWALPDLTILKLDNTALTEVPPSIGRLVKLTELSLSNNKLSSLPATLGYCQSMKSLNVCSNQFKAIPAVVLHLADNLKSLRRLRNPDLIKRYDDRELETFPHIKATKIPDGGDSDGPDAPDSLQAQAAKAVMSRHINYWLIDSLPSLACKLLDTYGNKYSYCHQCYTLITNEGHALDVILLAFADVRDIPFRIYSCSSCLKPLTERLTDKQKEIKEWLKRDLDERMQKALIEAGITVPDLTVPPPSNSDNKKCSIM